MIFLRVYRQFSVLTYFVVFLPIAASERLVKCRGAPVRAGDICPPVVSVEDAAAFHLMEILIFNNIHLSLNWKCSHYVLLDRVPDLLEGLLLCLLGLAPRGVVLVHVEALEQWGLKSVKQVSLVNKNAEYDDT